MTLADIKSYFGTGYQFARKTGMQSSNYVNWKHKGFVPIKTQIKLEKITNGALTASLNDIKRDCDDRAGNEGVARITSIQANA